MLETLKRLTSESDEALLTPYLNAATDAVRRRLYPFGNGTEVLPDGYESRVLEIAVYLYNRRGSEGETSHDEGDVSRTYEAAGVPPSMLADIRPFCGFPRGA